MAPRRGNDDSSRRNAPGSGPSMLGNYEIRNPSAPMATFRGNPEDNSFASMGDSYRPDRSFDFSVPAPGNISFNRETDSYRPQPRNPPRNGDRPGNNRRARPDLRKPAHHVAASRPFLRNTAFSTANFFPEINPQGDKGVKFRAPDEISDTSEESMEISESEAEDDNESGNGEGPPKKKQARMDADDAADGNSAPKWSNPDPYTALPPPDSSHRRGFEVLKMIRKAKIAPEAEKAKIDADSSDFISFDFPEDDGADSNLGNRKRTIDDMIKGVVSSSKPLKQASKGKILPEWDLPSDDNSSGTPWCIADHSKCANLGVWLHHEIIDFYTYVNPRPFEASVRANLIHKLDGIIRDEWRGARVRPFGSFASGLYLPTADMDLVVTSPRFETRGLPVHDRKKDLFRFRDLLQKEQIALPNSIEVIARAKVPIVKYIDRLTGLKVDVSFESNTGLVAIETFLSWKRQYPAMPILVTVIKHFLAMRGLNEPVNGGIGGFSVICLVVSLLQHLPQLASRNMVAEHNLGEVLMEFFQFYGRYFNTNTTSIQFNPPAWVNKNSVNVLYHKPGSQDRLSIIDPNNSQNDISGGSSNTATILRSFREAFEDLSDAMNKLSSSVGTTSSRKPRSILGSILSGDYTSFDDQREILRQVHEDVLGPIR